ncbi:hypothetical protein MASR1M45_12370 [Candidatus Kapaibacterium sp.]
MNIAKLRKELKSKIAEEQFAPIVCNNYDLPMPEEQQTYAELEELIAKKRELEIALEVLVEQNILDQISKIKGFLNEIDEKIDVLDKKSVKIFDNPAIIFEERAGILEFEANLDKNVAEKIAFNEYKETAKKPVADPEILKEKILFWQSIFDKNESLHAIELINRMLKRKNLVNNPANLTYQLNEVLAAEYEGILSNTSGLRVSNYIYKVN